VKTLITIYVNKKLFPPGNGERPYNNHKKYKKFFPLEMGKDLTKKS
jgi:hypothetical protein